MLLSYLFDQSIQFSFYILCTVTFFSTALLFFDSWRVGSTKAFPLVRGMGFLFFALSYVENIGIYDLHFPANFFLLAKVTASALIYISFISEPLLTKPKLSSLPVLIFPPIIIAASGLALHSIIIAFCLMTAFFCWQKKEKSFDKQLYPLVFVFGFLALSEALLLPSYWASSQSVFFSTLFSEYGAVSVVQKIVTAVAVGLLAWWSWGYVRFRFQLQLFFITFITTVLLFLIITTSFSYLLIRNMETALFNNLIKNTKVVQFALEQRALEVLSHTEAIASHSRLQLAIEKSDFASLELLLTDEINSGSVTSVTITNDTGVVLVNSAEPESTGSTLSQESFAFIKHDNKPNASLFVENNTGFPQLAIQATSPIFSSTTPKKIIGYTITTDSIDTAFVDGFKKATDLDVSLYSGNSLSATSITTTDGISRSLGLLETNKQVLEEVLKNGESTAILHTVLNVTRYEAYSPIVTQNTNIGMISVAQSQSIFFESVTQAVVTIRTGSFISMLLIALPLYLISRFIKENVEA